MRKFVRHYLSIYPFEWSIIDYRLIYSFNVDLNDSFEKWIKVNNKLTRRFSYPNIKNNLNVDKWMAYLNNNELTKFIIFFYWRTKNII